MTMTETPQRTDPDHPVDPEAPPGQQPAPEVDQPVQPAPPVREDDDDDDES
jgi:hypothetical protein